jgi:hypothetical protein
LTHSCLHIRRRCMSSGSVDGKLARRHPSDGVSRLGLILHGHGSLCW